MRKCREIIVKLKDLKARQERKLEWSKKQLKMVESVIESYDTNKGIIKVSKYNEVLDGNHRYWILKNHYGEDHEILVRQRRFSRRFYILISLLLFIPISPVLIIITLYNKFKEG